MAVWNDVALSYMQEFRRTDAEYYQPSYQALFSQVLSCNGERISRLAVVTDGIHGSPEIAQNGVRYISAKCVRDNEFTVEGCIYISNRQHEANPRTQLKIDDVIVTSVGTIGNTAVVDDEILPSNCDRHVAIIRIKVSTSLSPFFLSAFLNSKYGRFQTVRESARNVQLNLYTQNIGKIVVPRFGSEESNIERLVKLAYKKRKASKELYGQALQILESELGLDKLDFLKPVGYAARFGSINLSDAFLTGRIDAQCFAPTPVFYEQWFSQHASSIRLGQIIEATVKGRQQIELPSGTVDYCSIKNISKREFVGASKCTPTEETPLAAKDDLLLAITGATIGKIGIVKRYARLAFSGDLLRLRVKLEMDPHYLLLVLDHTVGQIQFNRWITGSTNGHLAPKDVRHVLVPRLSVEAERQIAELVEESLTKLAESEALLEQAKIRVEKLIEEAVQP